MEVRLTGHSRTLVYGALAVLALCGQPARGAVLTAELTCVLAGPSSVGCGAVSYGTVTLNDSVGTHGQIGLTVELTGIADKFRDLLLNFYGAGISTVSSGDGQASLSFDGFSLPPYKGLFDIGRDGNCCGWNSNTAIYHTTLFKVDHDLTLDMFNLKDSGNRLNVALHLQDLTGTGGSLKVGGIWEEGGGGGQEIPEPATFALLGGGLLVFAWALRRRKAC